jgi:hypothetical protein
VSNPQAKPVIAQTLEHWKKDTDLTSLRDGLETLHEEEQAAWKALWADVAALLERAK